MLKFTKRDLIISQKNKKSEINLSIHNIVYNLIPGRFSFIPLAGKQIAYLITGFVAAVLLIILLVAIVRLYMKRRGNNLSHNKHIHIVNTEEGMEKTRKVSLHDFKRRISRQEGDLVFPCLLMLMDLKLRIFPIIQCCFCIKIREGLLRNNCWSSYTFSYIYDKK